MFESDERYKEILTLMDDLDINRISPVEALLKLNELKNMLPICSSCKKIRCDKGFWHQVENYIREHFDAEFTHGICPDCLKNLYPDLYDSINSENNE